MAYKYYFFYNILCVIILQSFAKQLSLRLNIQPFAEYAVAPYVGAWIETAPRVVVDARFSTSHPTWVRGLKLIPPLTQRRHIVSHPTWVRGLKLIVRLTLRPSLKSHPTWVRGLKLIPIEIQEI